MEKSFFLHRIKHEGNVSYNLLSQGYLTLGWESFADTDIMNAAREEGYPQFDIITESKGANHDRSRWSMWYFARMNVGDIVVVPQYNQVFSVFKVIESANSIDKLECAQLSIKGTWNGHEIIWKNKRLYDKVEERTVDLGFYVKVEPIVEEVPRRFVTGKLISRMKIQVTNADITDIKEDVEKAIKAGREGKPITLYEESIDGLAEVLNEKIKATLDPDKFEELIKWYLYKCGANSAWIPAKNQSGKSEGADADIIAEFRNLKYIVYVQAKFHEGETSDWAVYQIGSYKEQMCEDEFDCTYATWVISSADKFSPTAIEEAKKRHVRLITGKEFARMLLDEGLLDVNDAFEK